MKDGFGEITEEITDERKDYISYKMEIIFYDVIVFAVTSVFLLELYEGPVKLTQRGELQQMLLAFVCVFACRLVGKIYGQIWRYGGIQCYMRLVCTDCVAF